MNNKKIISVIAILMAVLMLMMLIVSVIPTSAYAVTQSDIDQVQRRKEEILAQRQASQEKIDQLREQEASVLEQKAALDERNEYAAEQIALVKEQIEMYSQMLAEKEKEVEAAKAREEEQLTRYRTRVRAMEENGGYNILALLFNAASFSELLTGLDDIGEIMESDRQLEDEYIAAREEHQRVQAEYEQTRAELEARQAELEEEKAELEGLIAEADQLLAELAEDIEKAEKEYAIAEAARAAVSAQLSQLVAELNRQNEELKQNQSGGNAGGGDTASGGEGSAGGNTGSGSGGDNAGGSDSGNSGNSGSSGSGGGGLVSAGSEGVQGTGSLVWPVPCSHTVTSRYGWRIHPITGAERYHDGMDIDGYGHDGDIIIACDAGVVVTAQWSDSYGYYVMIDHGNGMQTLYAHMSSMAVSAGTKVSQGQTIGYLGSTGWSTGTHCHLEVWVNGGRTDPEAYFSGMTFYDC